MKSSISKSKVVQWVDCNSEDARLLIGEKLTLSPEVTSKMVMPRWSLDGRNDPVSLESMQSVLIDVGMLKTSTLVDQRYDETLLNELLLSKSQTSDNAGTEAQSEWPPCKT
jgi:hypothetical protein